MAMKTWLRIPVTVPIPESAQAGTYRSVCIGTGWHNAKKDSKKSIYH